MQEPHLDSAPEALSCSMLLRMSLEKENFCGGVRARVKGKVRQAGQAAKRHRNQHGASRPEAWAGAGAPPRNGLAPQGSYWSHAAPVGLSFQAMTWLTWLGGACLCAS